MKLKVRPEKLEKMNRNAHKMFSAIVLSTNASSTRTQHTLAVLQQVQLNASVHIVPRPLRDTEHAKVVSNRIAQVYEIIAKKQGSQFVFVFEDDIAVHMRAENIMGELQRVANLTVTAHW